MLMVNWTPVAVGLQPAVRSELRPFGRRPRRWEVSCDGPNTPATGCQLGGNPMYDQRVRWGSNFVRPAPERPSAPEPSATLRRKWREAQARLRRRQMLQSKRRGGEGGVVNVASRAHVQVQCEGATYEPAKRTLSVQTTVSKRFAVPLLLVPVKCKMGRDASGQITWLGDLIDWGAEAERTALPLVGGVLERATVTVLYEDDEAALHARRAMLEAKRLAECIKTAELEHCEAARRRAGLRARAAAKRADPGPAFKAVHGRALAAKYAAGLFANAVGQLAAAGYLSADPASLNGWPLFQSGERVRDHLDALVRETIVCRPHQFRTA